VYDEAQARRDLGELQALLAPGVPLQEARDILPFVADHADLFCLLAGYNNQAVVFDRLGAEISFMGQFRADLIAGDSTRRAYSFVEFEDAEYDSIFEDTRRQQEAWSRRCDHGMSQLVDWLWLTDDQRHSTLLPHILGPQPITITAVLIIGRDHFLKGNGSERTRLEWRRNRTLVNSQHVLIYTFDEMMNDLRGRLARRSALARTSPPTASHRVIRPRRR